MNSRRNLCGALAAVLAVARPFAGSAQDARPVATVETGQLAGEQAGDISIFRGVPYAAAPVGPLRWRPPQRPVPWRGARDAARFGPACPQAQRPGLDITRLGGAPEPTSEDCLTLNVWAPAGARRAAVMVWLHGGSGVMGAGSLPYYDGAAFARDGVVLVTVNYRLGALGGFNHPALTQEARRRGEWIGDYALMDQVAALAWVKRNIAAFGGDPGNVTIFGESAGGVSVLKLLSAEPAWGLFEKAIVESGGGWMPPSPGRGKAEAAGRKIAQALGAPADATTAQLRAIPARAIAANQIPGAVAADRRLEPDDPTVAIDSGRHAKVPLMIGVNSGEDSLLDHGGMDKARAQIKPGLLKRLHALYGPGLSDDVVIRNYFRDGVATAAARWVARRWSTGEPAYLYRFDHVDEAARGRRTRAGHGSEIFYVFETLGRQPDDAVQPTACDERLAAEMHARWVAFARTGSPNPSGAAAWPAYSAKDDRWMVFGPDGSAVQPRVLKPQLDWYERRIAPMLFLMRLEAEIARLFRF